MKNKPSFFSRYSLFTVNYSLLTIHCSLFTILILSSCDKVEGPYRKPVVVNDFCKTGIQDSTAHKKVLVEEFTGHFCGNCPPAAVTLNDTLKALYQHCLVVISIHADYFAGVCPTNSPPCTPGLPTGSFQTDFRSSAGTTWYAFFHIPGNPEAMVDRIDFPTNGQAKSVSAWGPAIATELTKKAEAKIEIVNTYNSTNRTVSVNVNTTSVAALSGNYKLQVVMTEDSIIDWQQWYSHNPYNVPDYLFHHVLRDALNTSWGETLVSGSISGGAVISKTYSYTINNNWNENHCNIVAFLYNDDTKAIVQVEEAPVK